MQEIYTTIDDRLQLHITIIWLSSSAAASAAASDAAECAFSARAGLAFNELREISK
jgi:hypothetical protein